MAGFFQSLLKGAADGFFERAYLRDYTHASKTFRTNAYGNSPKFKWNFHVYFDINKQFVAQNQNVFPADEIPGLLVKEIQLPKYSISLAEMNQYNRKRWVQTKINYDPVSITFHDDNNNQIRHLWYTYYSYYYNDPSQPSGQLSNITESGGSGTLSQQISVLNRKNTYEPDIRLDQNWGYLGEPANTTVSSALGIVKAPFFKSIRIYGFNQHSFALYELVNPIIEKFDHDQQTYYTNNGIMENRMTIRYESVKYAEGAVNGRTPDDVVTGFGLASNYDKTLSPIARPGANRTILGQGGLVDAGAGVLEDLANGNLLGAIQKAGTARNTFKNVNILQAAKSELTAGVIGATTQYGARLANQYAGSFPAPGAGTGVISQQVNSNRINSTVAPPITAPNNRPPGGP